MRTRFVVMLFLLLLALPLSAQEIEPTGEPVNPNANITWPPPVYVLRGDVTLRGTASVPGMTNYFIEFRPLIDGLTPAPEDAPWFPATLPSTTPVQDGVLGTWNTRTAPDGVYEIRLTINAAGQRPVFARVSPLRVENTPSPFAPPEATPTQPPVVVTPTFTLAPVTRPTLLPTPTALATRPMVTAVTDANVRRGDSTDYDRIGTLLTGQTAPIIGISSFGTGWYYIELPDGRRGFIAPSVVRAEGNLVGLPRIAPPPPPTPVATVTPLPTSTPVTAANLTITNVRLDPPTPVCNQTFTIYVTVQNNGTQATNSSGSISVVDRHVATGTQAASSTGGFPILQPGQSFEGFIPLTVSIYYNEQHSITIVADSLGQVIETNEGDNTWVQSYNLAQGGC